MADQPQADVVLGKELRSLRLAGHLKSTETHTEGNVSKRDLKAHPYNPPHTYTYYKCYTKNQCFDVTYCNSFVMELKAQNVPNT